MTFEIPVYGWMITLLSIVAFVLAAAYLSRVIRAYRLYHDERAAISLGKGMGLFVIALGLLISASGRFFEAHAQFSSTGLMMARGALLVLLATLVLANIRPESEGGGDQDHLS